MINKEGIDLIKKWEGCRLEAYKDPAGVWTIGYGHTYKVMEGDVITQQKADSLLLDDIEVAEKWVMELNGNYRWNENERAALTSFAFNCGKSNLNKLTAGCTRTKEQIAEKMLLYYNAGGKKLTGLVNRRKEERALFVKPVTQESEREDSIRYILSLLQEAADRLMELC